MVAAINIVMRVLAVFFWSTLLTHLASAQAETVIFSGNTASGIQNLEVSGVLYNVSFKYDSAVSVYGDPPNFDFKTRSDAIAATNAVRAALNRVPAVTMVGPDSRSRFIIAYTEIQTPAKLTVGWSGTYDNGSWRDTSDKTEAPFDTKTYADFIPAGGVPGLVNLTGTVQTASGTGLCAMVLASGMFMFSCNPNGPFSLLDLPRENNGTVKRQIYVDGFFPEINVLSGSVSETVVMTRSGTCPSYNPPSDPGFFPGSAGERVIISGRILLQNTLTPVCAMVLANGQHMFSCDGSGNYTLNIPLDINGQYKLQVYAQGFAPTIQRFDGFSPVNDVRMARAVECQ